MPVRDVIIVGAGPSGLSAAIACKQREIDYQVLEQVCWSIPFIAFRPQMVFFHDTRAARDRRAAVRLAVRQPTRPRH